MNWLLLPLMIAVFLLLKKVLDAIEYGFRWEHEDDGTKYQNSLRPENKKIPGGD
jgi:hypothetical protein